eukprot:Em0012g512a
MVEPVAAQVGAPSSPCYPSKPDGWGTWLHQPMAAQLTEWCIYLGRCDRGNATNVVAQTVLSGGFIGKSMQPVPVKVVATHLSVEICERLLISAGAVGRVFPPQSALMSRHYPTEVVELLAYKSSQKLGKAVRAGFHELELEKPEAKRRKRRSPKWPLLDKELYLWFSSVRECNNVLSDALQLFKTAELAQELIIIVETSAPSTSQSSPCAATPPSISQALPIAAMPPSTTVVATPPSTSQPSPSAAMPPSTSPIAVTSPSTSLSLFKSTTPPSGDDSTAGNKQILSHG